MGVRASHAVAEAEVALHPGERLRVLIANERRDRVELLAQAVIGLGHDVIAREIDVTEVRAITVREQPDVALVGLGRSSEHALPMIAQIVRVATCPVIAVLQVDDPEYVRQAARRGIFAYLLHEDPEELQSAIDIALARFAEYHCLKGAFERRSIIEQAKGILMARHAVDSEAAFDMLRERSRLSGRKVTALAQDIVSSHVLLLPPPPTSSRDEPDVASLSHPGPRESSGSQRFAGEGGPSCGHRRPTR
jgi:AmiR/NasT family two-component response regulator